MISHHPTLPLSTDQTKPIKLTDDITLSREDLLEVSKNISLYYAPRVLSTSKQLVILPIDPQHLHIYWNLGEYQVYEQPFTLIVSQLKENKGEHHVEQVHKMTINATQSRQKISLPVQQEKGIYSAIIGHYLSNHHFISLLKSNSMDTFRGYNPPYYADNNESDMINNDHELRPSTLVNAKKSLFVKLHYASSNKSGQGSK